MEVDGDDSQIGDAYEGLSVLAANDDANKQALEENKTVTWNGRSIDHQVGASFNLTHMIGHSSSSNNQGNNNPGSRPNHLKTGGGAEIDNKGNRSTDIYLKYERNDTYKNGSNTSVSIKGSGRTENGRSSARLESDLDWNF